MEPIEHIKQKLAYLERQGIELNRALAANAGAVQACRELLASVSDTSQDAPS